MNAVMTVVCVGGKTRRAVRACLDFLAPPFASRQRWKSIHKVMLDRRTILTAMFSFDKLRINWLSMTNQERQFNSSQPNHQSSSMAF
jgi:hypothetical protein